MTLLKDASQPQGRVESQALDSVHSKEAWDCVHSSFDHSDALQIHFTIFPALYHPTWEYEHY